MGAVWLALAAGGCAGPGRGLLVPVAKPPAEAKTRTVLAVTTRGPALDQPGHLFSGERGDAARYASLTLSLPKGRAPGSVPTDADSPDPDKHIALVEARELDATQFAGLARAELKTRRRALVFTHGYNTQFDEAVVRLAQIVDDTGYGGLPILFSWPSRGEVRDYGYDKDSANFSRDAMADLLARLARDPGIEGIDIFAHSMGNWLTMETLRQLSIAGDQKTLGRLGTIVLAAPDIDMDVFRTQIARLRPLTARIVLYASQDDYALDLSRRLFGGKIRAGANTDLSQFRALGIEAHDLSQVAGGLGRNHNKAFGDGTTIAAIGRAISQGAGSARQEGSYLNERIETFGRSVTLLGDALIPGPPLGGSR
ncbi:alpha/beta hydrolase [Bosea sp. (in: a-proteobacteria)]